MSIFFGDRCESFEDNSEEFLINIRLNLDSIGEKVPINFEFHVKDSVPDFFSQKFEFLLNKIIRFWPLYISLRKLGGNFPI